MNEQQLIALIEKMLNDSAKGLATKKEVLDELAVQIAKHEAFKAYTDDMATLKTTTQSLLADIKALRSNRFESLKDANGNYKGAWGSLKQCHDFGLFVLSAVGGSKSAAEKLEKMGYDLKKDMGGDAQSTGGALVPQDFVPQLINLVEKYGLFRQLATEWPMASDSSVAPKLSSGLTVYCPGAGVAPTKSDPTFATVGMVAHKWMTLTAIDSELNEDSAIAVGELVANQIALAFAKKEDEVGFLGDGTSTYFGHTGITGALRKVNATIGNIKSLVVGSGNLYSELTLGDFEKVVGTMPDFAEVEGQVNWIVNRYFYYSVMLPLALSASNATATEVVEGRGVREKTFLGYPVKLNAAMPKAAANSQICTIFGNLKQGALLGDRRRPTIERSNDAYFTSDQLAIRGTERVAPTIHGVGDTTNAGPIVGLITAAA